MNEWKLEIYVNADENGTVLEVPSCEGFIDLLPEKMKSCDWSGGFKRVMLDFTPTLGVHRVTAADGYNSVLVFLRSYREGGIEKWINAVTFHAVLMNSPNLVLKDSITKSDIVGKINNEISEKGLSHYFDKITVEDICLRSGSNWYANEIEEINELGVYSVWIRRNGGVEDVTKRIVVWVVRASKDERRMLKSGKGQDSHFLVGSKYGFKVRTCYEEVRAHVTNEINLSATDGSYIEDIGLRCGELETFFHNAKPGDHTEIDLGNNHKVTVVRLRNEI